MMINYLRRAPARGEVPAGKVVVHNHVQAPTRRLGLNGFRAWLTVDTDPRVEPCPCAWASELGGALSRDISAPGGGGEVPDGYARRPEAGRLNRQGRRRAAA
jgi:hypothetical protein